MTIIIALGGNVLTPNGKNTYKELLWNIKKVSKVLAKLVKNNKLVIVTGSGPQIGALILQNELAKNRVPPMPLDVLDAELEGELGYLLEEQLSNQLRENKIKRPIATLVTQVLVNKKDKAFRNPTKPIGPFYTKKEAEKLRKKGYKIINDAGRGFRRVVASPKPVKVIEAETVKKLVSIGTVVITCGGGGIPVVTSRGKLKGVEGVIDKDRASACLGKSVKASTLLVLTGVDFVYLNYGKKNQKKIKKMSVKEAKGYLEEGQFGVGSMKPKIEAAVDFLLSGGKRVVITRPRYAVKALDGKYGTLIVK
ncbi:MAG: carbamate kinase [Candidatus Woesearchaeota archaeon]